MTKPAKSEARSAPSSQTARGAPGKGAAPAKIEVEPIAANELDFTLVFLAVFTVFMVAVWFALDVNRVFDVPKALALKVGGCGIFLVWLLYGLFGPGYPWKSIRIFAGPVFALTVAVSISTLLSIDIPMSLYGVYERQFGLQGFLACVGLFVVTSTCLRSRRGAVAALASLMIIGGIVGSYSLLQRLGHDPYGFFKEPYNKVYSTLGNATFAGNALALIFPMSLILAIVAVARTAIDKEHTGTAKGARLTQLFIVIIGAATILALQIIPGYEVTGDPTIGAESRPAYLKAGIGVSLVLMILAAMAGSWGPAWSRFASTTAQRYADAFAAGGLCAASIAIAIGLVCTRTRGAWVGTAVAIAGGLVLLPMFFKDDPKKFKVLAIGGWGGLAALITTVTSLVILFPDNLYSATIKSIPYAFSPKHTVYGKGQGTRPYLWAESPRVLLAHGDTLERKYEDLEEAAKIVKPDAIEDLDLTVTPLSESEKSFDKTWRTIAVWPFGIGIETYRYAFMSHKSKKLEALDPMTNHDNPHNNYLYTLASFGLVGLAAYLWLLGRLVWVSWCRFAGWKNKHAPVEGEAMEGRTPRAMAFGVLTSFFSYSVYSLAGFDSVACAVFLYFFLGCAAVYFNPAKAEPRRSIIDNVLRRIAELRGRDPNTVPRQPHTGLSIVIASVLGILLVHSMVAAATVREAEQAFVGGRKRTYGDKINDIKRAIELNPYESFYKQSLGSAYSDAARQYRQQAMRLDAGGRPNEARALIVEAERYTKQAEAALYAALDHAWAPENVFISAFQMYYSSNRLDKAEYALERALEHSPHLGAVRANLAVLKLERRAYDEALVDCKWVLEVDPNNAVALRTCGRAEYYKGRLGPASEYLQRALTVAPKDSTVKSYIADVEKAKKAGTSSAS